MRDDDWDGLFSPAQLFFLQLSSFSTGPQCAGPEDVHTHALTCVIVVRWVIPSRYSSTVVAELLLRDGGIIQEPGSLERKQNGFGSLCFQIVKFRFDDYRKSLFGNTTHLRVV